jgi:hypothetical protein
MNNRRRGIKWELACIHAIRHLFPEAVSSRAESRNRDAQKVDICYTGDFNIQCKLANRLIKYDQILAEMPEEGKINVIFNKFTRKSGNKFLPLGTYAMLTMDDFIKMMENYVGRQQGT